MLVPWTRADVPMPDTCFLTENEITVEQAREPFLHHGRLFT